MNYQINEDKEEISKLKSTITISCWKDTFDKLIPFLHSKIHNWNDKDDKYLKVINDMYKDEDIEDIELSTEKGDYEL